MLHIVAPSKHMIMWHCRHLLDGLGAQSNSTMTALLGILRIMMSSRVVYCMACEAFVAKQAAYQLAAEPQVQQRLAIYVAQFRWHGLNVRSTEVFILRSMLWARLPGMYFKSVLEAFLRENGKSIPLKFKWATDMEFVPYSEMMTYRCGVLVPNDLTMASFAEAYAMGFPLFLPVDEWLYRLQKSVPYGFMVHAVSLPGDHPSPFWQEKSRALTTVMMWLRLSDFSTWPFTQRFCSVPELLEGLMKTPLEKISLAMLEWMAKSQEEGLRRWSGLLHSLQQGSEVMSESSLEVLQESVFGPGYVSRSDLLYSALACEHEKFDKFGWPAFRSVVEANAVAGFPLEQDIAFFTDVALLDLGEAAAESQVRSFNVALQHFLKNLSADEVDIAFAGLGHCHLGVVGCECFSCLR
ncbi:unnamed protein product [Durusdinium trenchii]|uniref:Uncharacterized protein n=1 Tax=Durusdinium trenchii TaxID=1381693 RepID=A0ABP0P9G9_9DINO